MELTKNEEQTLSLTPSTVDQFRFIFRPPTGLKPRLFSCNLHLAADPFHFPTPNQQLRALHDLNDLMLVYFEHLMYSSSMGIQALLAGG